MFKKIILPILTLFVGIAIGMFFKDSIFQEKQEKEPTEIYSSEKAVNKNNESNFSKNEIPAKVFEILKYINEHQSPPDGYVGGRKFKNLEGLLPKISEQNKKIVYKEWDVNPKIEGRNRGPQRLVTSDNGNAYYTADHYKSFKKIQ